jgi:PhoH-like ATPase
MAEKIYILDTNVLVHDPQSLYAFKEVKLAIPMVVLEELDQFKSETTQRGRNAREVIRQLDSLRSRGSLGNGVSLDNGGSLQVLLNTHELSCADMFLEKTPDNSILNTVLCMKQKGFEVNLVSKDINMRVKADTLGVPTHDYNTDGVDEKEIYKGWRSLSVPAVQLKREVPDDLIAYAKEHELVLNEYVIVSSTHNEFNARVFCHTGRGEFRAVVAPRLHIPIQPRNLQQLIAFDLLLNDDIGLVTLLGPAGTGKTFLALVAALEKVLFEHRYKRLLVSRPVIPLGRDIGYLPGDVSQKLLSWMQPIYDNMDYITHLANHSPDGGHQSFVEGKSKRAVRKQDIEHMQQQFNPTKIVPSLDDLIRHGRVSLEALTYMRGRSIPYQYIFIDEVQNLTPHEVKTIISRVGEGSKIILAGDPFQIDSVYLDFSSNGLVVSSQKLKNNPLSGTVFLETSERSALSTLAAQLL